MYLESRQAGSLQIYLTGDRCRDGPHLNFCAARFLGRIQQKLTAAKINGSRPFAHAKASLLAKACDRLILESQLTPGLDASLHGRALANIIVLMAWTAPEIDNVIETHEHKGEFKEP